MGLAAFNRARRLAAQKAAEAKQPTASEHEKTEGKPKKRPRRADKGD